MAITCNQYLLHGEAAASTSTDTAIPSLSNRVPLMNYDSVDTIGPAVLFPGSQPRAVPEQQIRCKVPPRTNPSQRHPNIYTAPIIYLVMFILCGILPGILAHRSHAPELPKRYTPARGRRGRDRERPELINESMPPSVRLIIRQTSSR